MKEQNEETSDKRLTRGKETYRAIILAAMEIISEKGISGITASRLADKALISKSSLFHHFKSIDQIPQAVLDLIFEEMTHSQGFPDSNNLKEYLTTFGQRIFLIPQDFKKIIIAFFSYYHEAIFNPIYQKKMAAYLEESKKELTQQILKYAKKPLSPQKAAAGAAIIIASLDGLGLHMLIGESKENYQRAWEIQSAGLCLLLEG